MRYPSLMRAKPKQAWGLYKLSTGHTKRCGAGPCTLGRLCSLPLAALLSFSLVPLLSPTQRRVFDSTHNVYTAYPPLSYPKGGRQLAIGRLRPPKLTVRAGLHSRADHHGDGVAAAQLSLVESVLVHCRHRVPGVNPTPGFRVVVAVK